MFCIGNDSKPLEGAKWDVATLSRARPEWLARCVYAPQGDAE